MGNIISYFDKLEDRTRAALSRHPIVYALIGGTSIVLFWRGVWMVADEIPFLTGPISILISTVVLLIVGLFVSFFIGDTILISGLKRGKRVDEKVISKLKTELELLNMAENKLSNIEHDIKSLKSEIRSLSLKKTKARH
ncbi:MAG: hypothetical protein PHC70_01885 [Patescibacteria group bacterium]|nr:hypothetical protein [Patescibacteria group bacterium]